MGRLCPIDSLVSHVCCVKLTCTRTRVFRLFSSVCLFLPPLRKKGKRGPDCAGAVCRHGRRRHRWRRGRIRRLLGPLERDGLKRLSPLQSPARAGMGVSALLPRRPYWVVLGRRLDRIDSRVPSCVASTLPADARSFLNGLSAWAKKKRPPVDSFSSVRFRSKTNGLICLTRVTSCVHCKIVFGLVKSPSVVASVMNQSQSNQEKG